MGIFTKKIGKGAYSGRLTCPACHGTAIRFVENVGPYRLRYKCRKCGQGFQYETGRDMTIHPYAPFNNNKFNEIVRDEVGAKRYLDYTLGRKNR